MAASPTKGDVKALNKLARQLSKDGMTYGSPIDCEIQKIQKSVLSTTVAELNSFMKCFGSCQFLRGLWMDFSP